MYTFKKLLNKKEKYFFKVVIKAVILFKIYFTYYACLIVQFFQSNVMINYIIMIRMVKL